MKKITSKIEINREFAKVEELVKAGKNVLVTGRAGTGKSTLLEYLRGKIERPMVVLAPTGVAAVNVGGQTIHSFFGFKPNITTHQARLLGSRTKKKIYRNLDVLVVDEISMVRADLWDCVDGFLRQARKSQLPFGGLQVVMFGDLYQLPPVVKSEEKKWLLKQYRTPYFFSAEVMDGWRYEIVELEKIYRQSDPEFIEILNGIRNKDITEEQLAKLNQRYMPEAESGEGKIYLTTTNRRAEEINQQQLATLPGKERVFWGELAGEFGQERLPAPRELRLKVGAQVMMVNNDRQGRWVNGSLGVVKQIKMSEVKVKVEIEGEEWWVEPYVWELFRYEWDEKKKRVESEIVGSYWQLPMILAWATTIHKAQGKTFDRVVVDVGRGTFTTGQLYVALSRCTSLAGLELKRECKRNQVRVDWQVVKFLNQKQYDRAEKEMSWAEKKKVLAEIAGQGGKVEIVYLKGNGMKSRRVIEPMVVERMEYLGKEYEGVRGFCHLRQEDRVFRIDRILELREVG